MLTEIKNSFQKLIAQFQKGKAVNETQKSLFRVLLRLGRESSLRLEAEIKTIECEEALTKQTLKYYAMLPPGDEAFEAERIRETERFTKLHELTIEKKREKTKEHNDLLLAILVVRKDIPRQFPGLSAVLTEGVP